MKKIWLFLLVFAFAQRADAQYTRAQAAQLLIGSHVPPLAAQNIASLSTGLGVLPNNTYELWRNAAGSANLSVLKADGSNNTVVNGPTSGNVQLAVNGTAEVTVSDDKLAFSGASAKIVPGATSLLIRNNADAASNVTIADAGTVTLINDLIDSTAAKGIVLGEASRAATVTTATTLAAPVYDSISASTGDLAAFVGFGVAANGPVVDLFKTRATSGAATTIVNSGDTLGQLKFFGANGTTYDPGAIIIAKVDATPGASADMPGSLDFQLSPDGSATPASVLKLTNDKLATFTGKLTSTATADLGWTRVNGANTACNTTCTSACVFGWDAAAPGALLACTDATADSCLCAGAS